MSAPSGGSFYFRSKLLPMGRIANVLIVGAGHSSWPCPNILRLCPRIGEGPEIQYERQFAFKSEYLLRRQDPFSAIC